MAMNEVGARPPDSRESNLFDLLRILAACLVLVGHAWILSGLKGVPVFAGIAIHHLGVYIFFAISGYLLGTSWTRNSDAIAFLVRRCFRIFPALIGVVLLSIFVLGPLATGSARAEYFVDAMTWQYLLNLTLFAQYELPGVFSSNPEPVVNGSLWSLGVEFSCYLLLVLLGLIGVRTSFTIRAVIAAGIAAMILGSALSGPLRTTAIAVMFFMLGSLCSRGGILAKLPAWPGLIALFVIAPMQESFGTLAAALVVTYTVVAMGAKPSRLATMVRRMGDPSYGMYLWGFPTQQVLIATFGPQQVLVNIAAVLPVAAALGYLSWHLIERRAIRRGAEISARIIPREGLTT